MKKFVIVVVTAALIFGATIVIDRLSGTQSVALADTHAFMAFG